MAEVLAGEDVGDMHLDHRHPGGANRILQRDGGWAPETLAEALPALSSLYTPMQAGSDAIKWNPV